MDRQLRQKNDNGRFAKEQDLAYQSDERHATQRNGVAFAKATHLLFEFGSLPQPSRDTPAEQLDKGRQQRLLSQEQPCRNSEQDCDCKESPRVPAMRQSYRSSDAAGDASEHRTEPVNARIDDRCGRGAFPVVSQQLDLHWLGDRWPENRKVAHGLRSHTNTDQFADIASEAFRAQSDLPGSRL